MLPLKIEGVNVLMRGNGPGVSDLFVKVVDGSWCVSHWEPTPDEVETMTPGQHVLSPYKTEDGPWIS